MKRLFDIVVSLCSLIVLGPFLCLVAIVIKLDSKGPIFYKQIRVGKDNIDFHILKFRSMYTDSDKQNLITIGDKDPRITPLGYYIRKYKIDELPQLINVLRGDMSLVGPRPEVRKYVDLYNEEQLHVLDIRPGVTDAASIKYRNENKLLAKQTNPMKYYQQVVMPDKLNINLEYVRNHSFIGDIKLIVSTIFCISIVR